MYKLLLFLNKTNDEKVRYHFYDVTLKHLENVTGQKVVPASIESNLLSELKFEAYCEIETDSKEKMNELMATKHGKELNKDLMEFHNYLTFIFVDYDTHPDKRK